MRRKEQEPKAEPTRLESVTIRASHQMFPRGSRYNSSMGQEYRKTHAPATVVSSRPGAMMDGAQEEQSPMSDARYPLGPFHFEPPVEIARRCAWIEAA
jgi:hypothetical protein